MTAIPDSFTVSGKTISREHIELIYRHLRNADPNDGSPLESIPGVPRGWNQCRVHQGHADSVASLGFVRYAWRLAIEQAFRDAGLGWDPIDGLVKLRLHSDGVPDTFVISGCMISREGAEKAYARLLRNADQDGAAPALELAGPYDPTWKRFVHSDAVKLLFGDSKRFRAAFKEAFDAEGVEWDMVCGHLVPAKLVPAEPEMAVPDGSLLDLQIAVRNQIINNKERWCSGGIDATLGRLGLPVRSGTLEPLDETDAKRQFIQRVHSEALNRVCNKVMSRSTANRYLARAGLPILPELKEFGVRTTFTHKIRANSEYEAREMALRGNYDYHLGTMSNVEVVAPGK